MFPLGLYSLHVSVQVIIQPVISEELLDADVGDVEQVESATGQETEPSPAELAAVDNEARVAVDEAELAADIEEELAADDEAELAADIEEEVPADNDA